MAFKTKIFAKAFTSLLFAGLLASCASNPFIVEITDCPAVAFVKYANTVTMFPDNSEMRVEDVAYTVHLSDLNVDCQDEGEGVTTHINFTINGERGPQGKADAIDVSYFVTVLREGDQMMGKRVFDSRIHFQGADRARTRERITQVLPNDTFADQYHHEVLIGFQLSENDAAYNLRR